MPYKDLKEQRAAQKRSYERNKDRYFREHQTPEWKQKHHAWGMKKRAEVCARVNELKSKPCADCGIEYPPYVNDFDHVRGDKLGAVSWLVSQRYALTVIEEEIAKCDVVCSNCHRERTHKT